MARERISFTTCNLYNLNRPGLPIYTGDGWTGAQYDAKIAWLGAALDVMRADVMGFQELWHIGALDDALMAAGLRCRRALGLAGGRA